MAFCGDERLQAASKVLRKHFSTLMKVIIPLKVTAELYSEEIVDRGILKEVRVSSEGNVEKACDILDLISDKVKEDPDVFEMFCCILEKEDSTKECAKIMRDDYKQHFRGQKVVEDKNTQEDNIAATVDDFVTNGTTGQVSHNQVLHYQLGSDWIKQTKPQLSPYLPQVGDKVVYCWEGHKFYNEIVQKWKVYSTEDLDWPWKKFNLQCQTVCKVTEVWWEIPEDSEKTFCCVNLVCVRRGPKTAFTVKYRDLDSVPDFLILKSMYDASLTTTWKPGDKFVTFMDGGCSYGTVLSRTCSSNWQCYKVQWDDGNTRYVNLKLSPWEMEPISAEPDCTSKLLTVVSKSLIQENEKHRILQGLVKITELDEAYEFLAPVNSEEVPTYNEVIPFPTDLSTIRERLTNGFYRRKEALLWEVALIYSNALEFNEEQSLIVTNADIIVETMKMFISDPSILDPLICYKSYISSLKPSESEPQCGKFDSPSPGKHHRPMEGENDASVVKVSPYRKLNTVCDSTQADCYNPDVLYIFCSSSESENEEEDEFQEYKPSAFNAVSRARSKSSEKKRKRKKKMLDYSDSDSPAAARAGCVMVKQNRSKHSSSLSQW